MRVHCILIAVLLIYTTRWQCHLSSAKPTGPMTPPFWRPTASRRTPARAISSPASSKCTRASPLIPSANSPSRKTPPFHGWKPEFHPSVRENGQNSGWILSHTIQKQQQPTAVVKLLLLVSVNGYLEVSERCPVCIGLGRFFNP